MGFGHKFAAIAGIVVCAQAQAGSILYSVVPLQSNGGIDGCQVTAISTNGLTAGNCTDSAGDSLPVMWDATGNLTVLAIPSGARYGTAYGINKAGDVVGKYLSAKGQTIAVRWVAGVPHSLVKANVRDSIAIGINNNGDIVGSEHEMGVVWTSTGETVTLMQPAIAGLSFSSYPQTAAINDAGQVLGAAEYVDASGNYLTYPIIWSGTQASILPTPSQFPSAVALSNAGVAAGFIEASGAGNPTAWTWTPSAAIPLPTPNGALSAAAVGINRSGEVLGYAGTQPVVWANGTPIYLTNVMPMIPGATQIWPVAISDNGWITVYANMLSPPSHASFVLKPVRNAQ